MIGPSSETTVYARVLEHVFSGDLQPGSRVVEGRIAKELGVSRIPVRESLRRMVGQGLLTSEADGNGIRVRQYTPDDVRGLFEFRELLEGGVSRGAARSATETDIARLEYLFDQSLQCVNEHGTRAKWGKLDHAFHEALADASHNERMASALKTLLTECHFLFYVFPSKARDEKYHASTPEEEAERRRHVLETEHLELIQLLKQGDAEGAEDLSRRTMRASGERVVEVFIKLQFPD
ncbi:GntR family transcriptional regulator [Aeoliella sp.]|uniref:GntR family transcriptional regulator n=1 Tax=Aeoliella sp. TaxID=2795800 RepID=UPI003CCC41F7